MPGKSFLGRAIFRCMSRLAEVEAQLDRAPGRPADPFWTRLAEGQGRLSLVPGRGLARFRGGRGPSGPVDPGDPLAGFARRGDMVGHAHRIGLAKDDARRGEVPRDLRSRLRELGVGERA